ncbi:hypothetical protein [Ferrigenium sp. UT5]|uniref:hypothetical protein n=1 Tax=Ferrigenium sp. UT5 TaxID=3242105 RepID=UPI003553E3D8
MPLAHAVVASICAATPRPFELLRVVPVGGGDINRSFLLEGADGARYFLKLNTADCATPFL